MDCVNVHNVLIIHYQLEQKMAFFFFFFWVVADSEEEQFVTDYMAFQLCRPPFLFSVTPFLLNETSSPVLLVPGPCQSHARHVCK